MSQCLRLLMILFIAALLVGCGGQADQTSDDPEKKSAPVTVPADKKPDKEKVTAAKEDAAKGVRPTPQEQSEMVTENGPDPSMPKTITGADIEPLSDDEVAALTNCQSSQAYSALGQTRADAYFDNLID